jgi:capsular exopolysaccharide synthesis family protein
MSRIDEALKRAAAAPRLAAANGQRADRSADRVSRTALEQYPREEDPLMGPADDRPVRPLSGNGRRPDVVAAPKLGDAYKGRLVIDPAVLPAAVEQYRRLAAAMHHLQSEQGLARLVISSVLPREGKTLTAVNLAMALSESYGRRVLLVDADLRHPSIHEALGLPGRHGLADALHRERRQFQFYRVSKHLWVLPAGVTSGDPLSALASTRFEQFLDEVASDFDWILLDAPPIGAVAEASLLVRLTRAVLLVIAAGSTPYNLAQKVVADIGREHIVGTVLNRAAGAPVWGEYYLETARFIDLGAGAGELVPQVGAQKVEQLRP